MTRYRIVVSSEFTGRSIVGNLTVNFAVWCAGKRVDQIPDFTHVNVLVLGLDVLSSTVANCVLAKQPMKECGGKFGLHS